MNQTWVLIMTELPAREGGWKEGTRLENFERPTYLCKGGREGVSPTCSPKMGALLSSKFFVRVL